MNWSVSINTKEISTAVDKIILSFSTGTVSFKWHSGQTSEHKIPKRDQIRFYIRHLMLDDSLSYGVWANQCLANQILN